MFIYICYRCFAYWATIDVEYKISWKWINFPDSYLVARLVWHMFCWHMHGVTGVAVQSLQVLDQLDHLEGGGAMKFDSAETLF